MNNVKSNNLAAIITIACAILFPTTNIGCSNEPRSITGKVVDKSGVSLSDVTVKACYSGWGWSGGAVVWDKDYCSGSVLTNNDGVYVINFKGPGSMRLLAKKEGWIQTQDFNATHSRIVLTKSEDHSSRLRAEAKQRELKQRKRLPEESETDYYCRVILPEVRSVNLNYQDETLSITPALLVNGTRGDALFAVHGSSRVVNAFFNEVLIKINGETPDSNLSLMSVETSCGLDVHFIGVNIPGFNAWADAQVEILVPSISAMVDMQIWVPDAGVGPG